MRIRTLIVAAALPAVLIVGPLAGSALAHVEVDAPGAAAGGSGTVTFDAEAEETTPLTKLEVVFPAEPALLKVTVPAKDGWTSAVTGGETPSRITWTATAGGITPEKTGTFPIQVGQFPVTDEVVFKALVTYADGTVVSWIELPADGGPEPEHPAPVLKLSPGEAAATTAAAPAGSASVAVTSAPAAAPAAAAADTGATGSPEAASTLVALVVAVLVTVGAVVASRRRHPTR